MAGPAERAAGRIFISYRREESAYPAGWLFDRLTEHFGPGQVFKDVDSIELGDDFVEAISAAVGSCDVLLALIGDRWLSITDADGRRRIDNADDFVRVEIEAALRRRVRVVPILIDGARMPHPEELPATMAELARRQALELSPNRFDFDTSRLLKVLDKTLVDIRAPGEGSMPASHGERPGDPDKRHARGPDPVSAAGTQAEPPPVGRRPDAARPPMARWVAVAGLAAVLVLLLAAMPLVLYDISATRPNQPGYSQIGGWTRFLWLLPAAPVAVAAMAALRSTDLGVALGSAVSAVLWVLISAGAVTADVPEPARATLPVHVVLLMTLVVTVVALTAASDGARRAVTLNRWGPAALALLLVSAGISLRTGTVLGLGSPSSGIDPTGFALLIPLLLGLPAAVLRLSPVQRKALWTVALWQLGYEVVIRAGAVYERAARDGFDPQHLSRPLTYLAGTVCLLVAIRVGQGSGGRMRPPVRHPTEEAP